MLQRPAAAHIGTYVGVCLWLGVVSAESVLSGELEELSWRHWWRSIFECEGLWKWGAAVAGYPADVSSECLTC